MLSRLQMLQPFKPKRRQEVVDVAGRSLPLVITHNARSKRLVLRVEPGGQSLKITAPIGVADGDIYAFLKRQDAWLRERISRLSTVAHVEDGQSIPIRGTEHRITLTGHLRSATRAVTDDMGRAVLEVGGAPEHLKRRVSDYLKKEARRDLTAAVGTHSAAIGRAAKTIRLRDTRSRWGSCTSDGALSFSWRIVMSPPFVIDYLAAHEVAHLVEMNHGPRFWTLCHRLCPDTPRAKAWLKENGSSLHAVRFE